MNFMPPSYSCSCSLDLASVLTYLLPCCMHTSSSRLVPNINTVVFFFSLCPFCLVLSWFLLLASLLSSPASFKLWYSCLLVHLTFLASLHAYIHINCLLFYDESRAELGPRGAVSVSNAFCVCCRRLLILFSCRESWM